MSETWGGRWLKGAAALGGLLAALAVPAAEPAEPAARIEHFSPTGRAEGVSQIEARFSASMVTFGDLRGPLPFVIDCPVPGAARWVDPTTWVYGFEGALPAGIACRLRLREGLRTLAGHPVEGENDYAFDTGGPRITATLPDIREPIDERQIFLLTLAAEADADSIREDARCVVAGEPAPRRIELLTGQRRTDLLARLERTDEPRLVMVQCTGDLPADTDVTLSWGTGIRTPGGIAMGTAQPKPFRVHPPFTLHPECEADGEPIDRCNPELRIGVRFSVPVAAAAAAGLRLRGPGAVRTPVPDEPAREFVETLWFAAPFAEQTTLRVEVPPGLTDATGRPLVEPPPAALTVRTGQVPRSPLVRFQAGDILEARAGAVLPVMVRDLDGPLRGRRLRLGPATGAPPDPAQEDDALLNGLRRLAVPTAGAAGARPSPFAADAPTEPFSIEVPSRRGLTTAGIPLPGPGVYVVEADTPWLETKDPYPATLALVTNLAVNVKTADEGPWLVWVTTLDEARPVTEASVTLTDACTGTRLGEGRTDPDGIARIAPRRPTDATGDRCPLQGRILVSARTGEDLSFTLLSERQSRGDRSGAAPILHTVYDRTLLRAGETLSMKHLLRRPVMDGFAVPAERPDTLKIRHLGSDSAYELPLVWDAQGIAESAWVIPPDAPLGPYSVGVDDPRMSFDEEGQFEVAEFRIPAMTARVDAPGGALVSGDEPAFDLAVNYLSGAPAADWPVSLSTRLEDDWEELPIPVPAPYDEFDFSVYRFSGETADDPAAALCRPDPDPDPERDAAPPIRITLDAAGQARVSLPPLPQVCEPRTLLAMLDYQDANGQQLTATHRLGLWSAAVRLGLKVEPRSPGDPLRVAVQALDPAGQPAAGQTITLDLLRRQVRHQREALGNGLFRDRSETRVEQVTTLCTGRTDRQGLLRCESRLQPTAIGDGLVLRAATRDARQRAAVAARPLSQTKPWGPWPHLDLNALRDRALTPDDQAVVERLERMAKKAPEFFDQGDLEADDGKTDYAPGETARLVLHMPFPSATALVTVEREGIMRAFVTRLAGERPTVAIPIEARYAPNARVSVLAVHGRQADAASPTGLSDPGRPDYVRGTLELRVDPRAYRLEVQVRPAAEVYPVRARVPVRIQVRRADGGPLPRDAEVAVAAVDEALLQLVPNRSWAIEDALLSRSHEIAVDTAVAFGRVLGLRRQGPVASEATDLFETLSERLDRMFQKIMSNGGGLPPALGTVRSRFDTLLLWRGRVRLDDRGKARIEVPLNDSLSRLRIVAVATAGTSLFGTGEARVRTVQDLALYAGLPPVVRAGDRFAAVFTAHNGGPRPLTVAATARVGTPTGDLPALPEQRFSLAPGASREFIWPIAVPADSTALTWEAGLQALGVSAADRLRLAQEVRALVPVRTYQATLASLEQPFALAVQAPTDAVPGQGGLAVALRGRLGEGVDSLVDYMSHYPYNCLEQQVSVAVALRDRSRWDAIVRRLGDYQDTQGRGALLRFFPGALPGDEVLTAYVLAIADEAGWPLPAETRDTLIAGLKAFLKGGDSGPRHPAFADRTLRRLLVIEALSRYGAATPDLVADLDLQPQHWPTSALFDWIAILGRVDGIPERAARRAQAQRLLRARRLVQGTGLYITTPQAGPLWWLMGSQDVDAVRAVLTLLPEADWRADLPRLLRGALARQRQGHWDLTTANAWGRLALERFSAAFERQPVTGRTQGTLGRETRGHTWTQRGPGSGAGADWLFPWPDGPARPTLTLTHQGQGRPWALVESRAAIPLKAPLFAGYTIVRTLTPVTQRRPGQWSRGDLAEVRLDLTAAAPMGWVVVNDPIPAGATILGSGFGGDTPAPARDASEWRPTPTYEERRFDGLRAYYAQVPAGHWTLSYRLRLNNAGDFSLPPTRVEALYLPELFGEWPNAPIEVTE